MINVKKTYLLGWMLLAATTAQASESQTTSPMQRRLVFATTALADKTQLDITGQFHTIIARSVASVTPRLALPVSKKLSLGIASTLGWTHDDNTGFLFFGAGPMLTVGTSKLFLNAAFNAVGVVRMQDWETSIPRGYLVNVGVGIQSAPKSMWMLEYSRLFGFQDEVFREIQTEHLFSIGYRHGQKVFFEVNATFVHLKDSDIIIPIPLPTVSIGYAF